MWRGQLSDRGHHIVPSGPSMRVSCLAATTTGQLEDVVSAQAIQGPQAGYTVSIKYHLGHAWNPQYDLSVAVAR